MKVSILTLGCKTNLSESDAIGLSLSISGHDIVTLEEKPDLCIINTCTVTAKSDYQSRQLIRRALRAGAGVVVTGCYAELRNDEIRRISQDIIIIKNSYKSYINSMLVEIVKAIGNGKDISTGHETIRGKSMVSLNRARPFVKIQDGCNYSCSYCTIPKARGSSSSRPPEDIVKEITALEDMGYEEVVLTGIHIGHYGYDLIPKVDISKLIDNILINTDNIRVRLGSIEVNEYSETLLDLLSDRRVCPHIHVPLQSGDDGILRVMKRPYSKGYFLKKINEILKRYSSIAIGTDVIVGFPGEGEHEFKNTMAVVDDMPFSYIHVFPYSDRPGTESSAMENHVDSNTKKERAKVLREIDRKKRHIYRKSQIGSTLRVLTERVCSDRLLTGKSENYLNVFFEKTEFEPKRIVNVRIYGFFGDGLIGIAEKNSKTS